MLLILSTSKALVHHGTSISTSVTRALYLKYDKCSCCGNICNRAKDSTNRTLQPSI